MVASTPKIQIAQRAGGITIAQRRPTVTGVLGGLGLEEALLRIPLLLPICGHAQGIAAQRAASAARNQTDPHAIEHTRQLWREQAVAAAWRLAVDWPGCVGRKRALPLFKAVQQADGPETLATQLLQFLPGLISVESMADLSAWLIDSDSTAANVVRRARELESELGFAGAPSLLAGEALKALAQTALAEADFDPLTPAGAGIDVGPLAMRRHPLVERLAACSDYGALTRRLVAQLLDTLVIAGHLLDGQSTYPVSAWNLGPGIGMGRAITARGPVFHRVELDGDGKVAAWRVLAPTDWHFAPGGPLATEAQRLAPNDDQLSLLVLGFDPCSPWSVASEEAAHA